jgi:acyl-CoA reductase-like NAD-dependent aldehyde dehydrogenase
VVNIVHGYGGSAGDALIRHKKVKRIGFTGSGDTGRLIQRSAAESGVKHVSLELGGKNPMILCPDLPPEKAAQVAVGGMNFAWAGQSCGSTSRVLVHASIYSEVVERVATIVDNLNVGHPLEPSSQMGPVNSARQLDKVLGYIESGLSDGATLRAGGARPEGNAFERGYWVRPTVFADVLPTMRIAQEEVFGPLLSIMSWSDDEEAIELANSTDFGLTASVWTNDLARAMHFARRVDSGYVWINGSSAHYAGLPFSGRRSSGVGSEESLEELFSYTESKSISILSADLGREL